MKAAIVSVSESEGRSVYVVESLIWGVCSNLLFVLKEKKNASAGTIILSSFL